MPLFQKFMKNAPVRAGEPMLLSIVDNLNNILNTKRGYGSFRKDFGIRDLNEYSNRAAIAHAVVAEVRENILRFEPRVKIVDVVLENDDNPLHLSFRIECTISAAAQAYRLIFDTIFSRYRVEQTLSD